jgi:catechol 2,3-dioxygenase-like lactoylglutathione lyase family enzyme
MTEHVVPSASGHRWYSRPVLFVADLNRALRFYVDQLGFEKNWHAGDGAGTVCQVGRSDCEIILCQDPAPRQGASLYRVDREWTQGLAARAGGAFRSHQGSLVGLRHDSGQRSGR